MTPTDFIVQTLIAGAAARRQPAVAPAVAAVYDQLKARLAALSPPVDVTRIEERPDSPRGRDYLAEDLSDAGADNDPALLAAAAALLAALLENPAAAPAQAIGVDLEEVTAAALTISDIASSEIGVRLRNSRFAGNVAISQTRAGATDTAPSKAVTNQFVGNKFEGPAHFGDKYYSGDETGALDLDALVERYLAGLYAECNELLLANEGPVDNSQRRQPHMQRVYVDLHTDAAGDRRVAYRRLGLNARQSAKADQMLDDIEPGPGKRSRRALRSGEMGMNATDLARIDKALGLKEGALAAALTERMTVFEAIEFNRQLVLLGDPGGGKSTLTRRLAGLLAAKDRSDLDAEEVQARDDLIQRFGRWLLPVRIVLSRWAQHLPENAAGTADDLIAECVRLLAQTADAPGLKAFFTAKLTGDAPAALILLDGLDEVTDAGKRAVLLRAVTHFHKNYDAVPLLITCRVRPWQAWQEAGAALSLPCHTIDKLDSAAIHAFIGRWHDELERCGRYEPAASAQAQARLRSAIDDPDRKDLFDMAGTPLLLTMMARVNYEHGLPDSRAELYEAYFRQLLWEWEKTKQDDRGQPTSLQRLLNRAKPPVPVNNLEVALSQLAYEFHTSGGDRDTVDIPESKLRAALEALYPGARSARAAWAVDVLDLIHERTGLLKDIDHETLQFSHRTFQEYLAARHLATGDAGTMLEKFQQKIDQEQWAEAVRLAFGFQIAVQSQYDVALVLLEDLLPAAPNGSPDWRRVLLLGEVYVRLLVTPQRLQLAQSHQRAARLTKQIPELLTAAMQNPALPPRQRLDAGLLLADLDIDPPGLDDFVTAPGWNFKIGRYPVTNKQFRRFVDAGGYRDDRWWQDEAGRRYRDRESWKEPRLWHDPTWNRATQPVVGVSWYEANAYCAWLTAQMRAKGEILEHEEARLPTQAEWEQAAHRDAGEYPWGKQFVAANANTKESGLSQTTPVHMYTTGATPEGVFDLSGNVWEWSHDRDKDGDPYMAGGAHYSAADSAKSSARYFYGPRSGDDDLGFRCVVVPISR